MTVGKPKAEVAMSAPTPTAPAIIEARSLTKSYAEGGQAHVVLDGVDLDVAPGDFVAVLGKSGSGKTTLLNLLSGIDQPTAGSLRVAGQELTALSETERTLFRRRHVGFVFQFFNLIPTLTVFENVTLPLALNPALRPRDRGGARQLLDRVGLEDRGDSFPEQLSGGEQQRVAIARALVHQPRIVLADEPTGNLDHETGEEVLELLAELVRSHERTLVVATHSREVLGKADRVLTIANARLLEASLDELPVSAVGRPG